LRHPELDVAVEALVQEAQRESGRSGEESEVVRQILVTGLQLMRENAGLGDLKLVNTTLKELRHTLRVFSTHAHRRKVAVFGSARTGAGEPEWEQARVFAERIAYAGWMVITGAGPGIMEAAQGGAGREDSFGVNIRLPYEQTANPTIEGDSKLIHYRYFFTRKVAFVKESHAIVLFPGGFGTHDEAMEALTLIQTGKSPIVPMVFVDAPGGDYWKTWLDWVRGQLGARGLISPEDFSLLRLTDDVGEAIREILNFYSNYHSSRYVGRKLVLRVRVAPEPEELEYMNIEFKDLVTRGSIEVSPPLRAEGGELPELPRVVLHFDRRSIGRLRQLIDGLNRLVDCDASRPDDASPQQIVRS
jgi:uncharacterized protein (TIGR00730 family)